ncbi:MAG: HepT-like ribonuclease domain-containing protein [Desulfomonilaceae bacterium]
MRNQLIHEYFDINLDIFWRTVTIDFPLIREQLHSIPGALIE